MSAQLADLFIRTPEDRFEKLNFAAPSHPELYGLGVALYGTAPDYMRFLRFVLNGGELDGQRIISPETFELMRSNQIGDLRIPPIATYRRDISFDVDRLFSQTSMSHTAGFLRTEADVDGMRNAETLWWAGFLNTHYWVDSSAGVAALLMTQTLPFCDPRYMSVLDDFERAVYQDLGR